MSDNKSSSNNQSYNSFFSEYQKKNLYKNDSLFSYSSNNKNNIQSTKYFDVYKQVKEEMKQNNSGKNPKNKNLKKNQLLYNLYLKNANQIDNYIQNNYPNITLEGTKNLDGINEVDLANEIKNNQSHWREMNQGLKYRNPELNKNCEKLNLTPIPINKDIDQMNEYEKREFEKTKKNAVFMRKMEYTHAKPVPITEEYINNKNRKEMILKYMTLNKIKIIQRWFRKYRNIKNEKELINNRTPYYDENDVYKLWEEQYKKDQEQFIQYKNNLIKFNEESNSNNNIKNNNKENNGDYNDNNKNINDNIINNDNPYINNNINNNYNTNNNINDYTNINKANDNANINFDDNINNNRNANINDNTNNYNYNYNNKYYRNVDFNSNITNKNPNYNIDNKNNGNINNNNKNNYNDEIDNNFNNNKYNNNHNIQTENSFYITGNKAKFFDNSKPQFDDLEQINLLSNPKTNIFKTQNNSSFNYYGSNKNDNPYKNNYINQLYAEKENSFDIININQNNNIDIIDNQLEIKSKPILNICFLSKYKILVSHETNELPKLKLIQYRIKEFLRNRKTKLNNDNNNNMYNTYYNKDKNNNINTSTPNNIKNINTNTPNINNSNNSSSDILDNMNDIKNNSLNKSYGRNKMMSELDSLQFFHNLTINKDGENFFDKIIGNEDGDENNSSCHKEKSINKNILKAKKNNIKNNNNNSNYSLSSENDNNSINNNSNIINKNKNNIIYIRKKSTTLNGKNKNDKTKMIIKDGISKNFYFDKIYYQNLDDIILKIKEIQSQIVTFLHKKEYNDNSYYRNYSSSSSLSIDINANENENNSDNLNIKVRDRKNNVNNFEIENNNNFNLESEDINNDNSNDKLKILKKLVIKKNKKLNNELNNNVKEYYDKKNKLNQIISITKTKLPLKIINIIKEHLKPIFIDIYQYNTIDYRRKKILLKIFNNINSKLKRCFEIWSDRPINLLIYKSKNCKYYHSLKILNNKIKRLIQAILNAYIRKYFNILILEYLNINNIDINNNQILYFVNKGNKNINIINNILKYNYPEIDENNFNNRINLKDYINILEKLNTNENINIIKNQKNENNKKLANRKSKFKVENDINIYKKNKIKSYTPIKVRNNNKQKYHKKIIKKHNNSIDSS